MAYSELLRNPLWQKKRLKIFERDNWKCTKCTDQFTNLQVHHRYYTANALPWEYPDSALTTYCELCHIKEEFIKWLVKFIEGSLKKFDFSDTDIAQVTGLIVRRVNENNHAESVKNYIEDIKLLLHG